MSDDNETPTEPGTETEAGDSVSPTDAIDADTLMAKIETLTAAYDAQIADLTAQNAALAADNIALKAVNYDLLMANTSSTEDEGDTDPIDNPPATSIDELLYDN